MRISLVILAIGLCLAAGQAWAGTCPGEAQDRTRVTVHLTIEGVAGDDTGYGFTARECRNLVILRKSKGTCHVGGSIEAAGKFYSCSAMKAKDPSTSCTYDVIDDSLHTCN
jgi:hypothetical protein